MELTIGELYALVDILEAVKKEKGLNVVDTRVYEKIKKEYNRQHNERNAKIMRDNPEMDWEIPNSQKGES